MPRVSKGLEEGDIQKLHTTPPEQLTDEELLLSTFCVDDLQRKSSAAWDKQHPKCLFCRKPYRYRTFQVQCHMTSRIKGNTGSQGRVVEVCSMESKKDDGSEIKHAMPWVQCFSCPSDGLDKFIQNALSDSATIRIQTNVMRNVDLLLLPGARPCSKTRLKQPGKLYKLWSHIRNP
jgi:hypothetical protein